MREVGCGGEGDCEAGAWVRVAVECCRGGWGESGCRQWTGVTIVFLGNFAGKCYPSCVMASDGR